MALVSQATKISLNSTKIPAGITDPGGSNLTNGTPNYLNLALTVAKTTVEDAVKATTFDDIRIDAVVGIEKQVADIITNDFENTINTVTYNIDWRNIEGNMEFPREFYTNAAAQYICTVDVYVVVT